MLWIIYAITSAFFTAISTILLKLSLKSSDPFFTAALQMVTATLFLLVIYVAIRGLPTFKTATPGLNFILLSGLAAGLSWMFYILGLNVGTATQVSVLQRINVVFIVIMCMTILGECRSVQYLIGAILVALGAGLITF